MLTHTTNIAENKEFPLQNGDIKVSLQLDKNGKIQKLIPDQNAVHAAATWMDQVDRQRDRARFPDQSFGDIVVCDSTGKPVQRIRADLLGGFLADRTDRPLDGVRDFLASPSQDDYISMIISRLESPDVIARIQQEYQSPEMTELALKKAQNEKAQADIKARAWTEKELIRLAVDQEKILVDNFGDPDALRKDIEGIENLIKQEGSMKLGEQEKNDIDPQGEKFLRGLLIYIHTIKQGFAISSETRSMERYTATGAKVTKQESGVNIYDTTQDRSEKRSKQRDSIAQELQNADDTYKNYATSNVRECITAAMYHLDVRPQGKTMTQALESTEQKAGKQAGIELSHTDIANNPHLSPAEKTLLMSWSGQGTTELEKIAKLQEERIVNAGINTQPNIEDLKKSFTEKPLATTLKTLAGPAICGALLWYGINNVFSKGKKWYTRLLGVPMMMIGLTMVSKGDDLLKRVGVTDMLKGGKRKVEQKIGETVYDVREFVTDTATVGYEGVRDFANRMATSDATEWTNLLMNEKIGPKIQSLPVASMLWELSEEGDERNQYNQFLGKDGGLKTKKVLDELNLSQDQKSTLKELLKLSWDRDKHLHPEKYAEQIGTGPTLKASELKMSDIIQSLDDQDKWYNSLPSWAWLPDGLRGTDHKTEALKIMATNIQKWGSLTLQTIERRFDPLNIGSGRIPGGRMDSTEIATFDSQHGISGDPDFLKFKEYFRPIFESATLDKTKTLREYLTK